MFLQKICFLDPRYKSTYIDPSDIDIVKNSIQLEMDEIGNQAKGKELKVQKNDGMYSKDWFIFIQIFLPKL